MTKTEFDFTPDPHVLIALAQTPRLPLDALCELIDNAVDSSRSAEFQDRPVEHPSIVVTLPSASQFKKAGASVRIRANRSAARPRPLRSPKWS